jgi:AcrR family transcriptional regulator
MAYRRTDRETARLAARYDAIIAAARALAGESGLRAVQIAPVAERAGVAAGTVYRYFPSKEDLVAAVVSDTAMRAVAAVRAAAAAAAGELSGLAAALMAFGTLILRARRLAFAMLAEVPDGAEAGSLTFRRNMGDEFVALIEAAIGGGHLPEQPPAVMAAAILGAMVESLVGPLASMPSGPDAERAAVQHMVLFVLRALGVSDARARGVVLTAASATPATLHEKCGRFLAPTGDDGARSMVNKTKPFILIDRKGRNTIQLRYGESSNDPKPFTLIVTPVYVAAKIAKEAPSHDDVVAYVETHAEELRTIAISKYERGFSTETLL